MIFSLTLFACFFTNCFSVYYCEMDKEKCDSLDNSQTISSSIYSGDYCGCTGNQVDITVSTSTINKYSFYENLKIKSVTFTSTSTVDLDDKAFYGCKNLQEIDFASSGISRIGISTFEGCIQLTTISAFPSRLTTIDDCAFVNNSKLASTVNFNPNLITIGDNAFQGTQITFDWGNLPSSLTSIGDYAFEGTKSKGTFAITEPTLTLEIGKYAFNKVTPAISGNLVIPKNVELNEKTFGSVSFSSITIEGATINEKAFDGLTVTGPITITDHSTINSNAFSLTVLNGGANNAILTIQDSTINSYGFRGINFASGGKIVVRDSAIKENSFEGIKGYPTLEIQHDETGNSRIQIKEEAFYNSQLSGNLEINDFVSYIGTRAFAHCSFKDTNLFIDSESIHDYAFAYSTGIKELTLGEHVVTFDTDDDDENFHGFEGCDFTKLTLNLKGKIPNRAFYRLTSIANDLTFSEDIQGIGNEAFAGCSGIPSIAFAPNPAKPLSIGYSAFYGCSEIASDLSFDRDISTIPIKAFCGCSKIKSVIFPNEITEISAAAFYECKGLGSIKLPTQLSTLGVYAFYGCSNMKGDLIIPNGLGTISSYAFYDCSSLDGKLEIGDSVKTIGSYAFYKCMFIDDLIIPKVTQIGSFAFFGCSGFTGKLEIFSDTTKLNTITISQGAFEGCSNIRGPIDVSMVGTLGKSAFSGCSSLTGELNFNSRLSPINPYIFNGCRSLSGAIKWPTPTSITSIGEYAFNGCSGLSGEFINLPTSVNEIKEGAFQGCTGFTGPIILSNIKKVRSNAFHGCKGFSGSLTIKVADSDNPTIIEKGAFDGCTGFKNGVLNIFIEKEEEKNPNAQISQYYRYGYILRIENQAFEDCKFKDIYYNGRFEPDCDYDIGIKQTKGIHTSSNYANKSFCNYPLHSDKLSGGAIAGITIACIVVVAVIVFLIVFFLLKKKTSKNKSDVEMNNDP